MDRISSTLAQFVAEMGDTAIRKRVIGMVGQGQAASVPLGVHVISEVAQRLLPDFKTLAKPKKHPNATTQGVIADVVKRFGAEKLVVLTLARTLGQATQIKVANITYLRNGIANEMQMEMDLRAIKKKMKERSGRVTNSDRRDKRRNSREYRIFIDQCKQRGITGADVDRRALLLVAAAAVEIVLQKSGIFKVIEVTPMAGVYLGHRRQSRIVMTEAFAAYWDQGLEAVVEARPMNCPIATPPLDWDSDLTGGYPASSGCYSKLIHSGSRSIKGVGDSEETLQAINTLQRTAWKVNRQVLDVFHRAYQQEWPDVGYSTEISEIPKPLVGVDPTSLDARQHKHAVRKAVLARAQYRADKYRMGRLRYIADVYAGVDRFYFVHFMDFRGRVYPSASTLSYQGSDAEKGLLLFAEGKPIGTKEALDWYFIHGANKFGEDKLPFCSRIQWVRDHTKHILAAAEDPIGYRWWTEADNPWQFLAWCLEFHELMLQEDPLDFVSHIPVAMDGSNNGLQIYSMVLRDSVGAQATNCVPQERPADAYQEVADLVTQRIRDIKDDPGSDPKHARWSRELLNLLRLMGHDGFPRAAVKRAVMTQPYGCTLFSCQVYILEWYFEWIKQFKISDGVRPFSSTDVYKIFRWVGELAWEAIGQVVVAARMGMEWLQSSAKAILDVGGTLDWTTPLGCRVNSTYKKSERKTIRFLAGRRLRITQVVEGDQRDRKKSINGVCPNWIHSLDAAAMLRTVLAASADGVTSFAMVHDSFATHAADAPMLASCLREAYTEIFSQDLILDLYNDWSRRYPEALLSPPPSYGTYDIRDLKASTYFFA